MRTFIFYIYSAIILYCILIGIETWFTWNTRGQGLTLIMAFAVVLVHFAIPKMFSFKLGKSVKWAFVILFIALYSTKTDGSGLQLLLRAYLVLSVFCLQNEYQIKLFRIIQRSVAILLVPSLILHYILLVNPLPPFGGIIEHPASINYIYGNYIFLIKNDIMYPDRFCGFTLEPGYIGSFCAFMLYADKFRMRNIENIVLLVSVISSLSLAGYLLTTMGFFMCKVSNVRIIFKRLLQIGCLVVIAYFIAQKYNDGDNYINEKIFDRLQIDEKKGIKGNNRVSDDVNVYYGQFLRSDNLLFGYSDTQMQKLRNSLEVWNSAGYKTFLMSYGLVRLLLILTFYYLIARFSNNKYYSMGFFIMIFIYFLATGYVFSLMWLMVYTLGIKLNSSKKSKNIECENIEKTYT